MKKKIFIIIMVLSLLLTGCNKDTNLEFEKGLINLYKNLEFKKALINLGDKTIEVKISQLKYLYNKESIQIIDENGNVYLTSYNNVILINEK